LQCAFQFHAVSSLLFLLFFTSLHTCSYANSNWSDEHNSRSHGLSAGLTTECAVNITSTIRELCVGKESCMVVTPGASNCTSSGVKYSSIAATCKHVVTERAKNTTMLSINCPTGMRFEELLSADYGV
jgi:hypothetical protein